MMVNLFMEYSKEMGFGMAPLKTAVLLKYIDDTLYSGLIRKPYKYF